MLVQISRGHSVEGALGYALGSFLIILIIYWIFSPIFEGKKEKKEKVIAEPKNRLIPFLNCLYLSFQIAKIKRIINWNLFSSSLLIIKN
jgi:dipeptide/tripeptide permease